MPKGYYDLMEAMHDKLQWHERAKNERPRVNVHIDLFRGLPTYLWIIMFMNISTGMR
jgi:hypothetical protein